MKNIIGLIVLLGVALGCSSLSKKDTVDNTATPPAKTESTKTEPAKTETAKPNPSDLTMEKFDQLKVGTKYEEVVKILGDKGNESNSSSSGKNEYASYKWESSDNASISASFKNGELTMKSHYNLKSPGGTPPKADLSMAKYEQIQTGMTLPEVVKIIGSDGQQTSGSVSENLKMASYKWEAEKYARINLSFKDDKVSSKSQSNLK
ncbi:MAG: DUF3862 domain-containing protein [Pyrinomonadaceae bacterium]